MADDLTADVPHLTDAYHKARKSYTLAAALLMAWALVGINLKDTPYFELVNPQAAPLVLIAVTLYFAARITLEWLQLDPNRRRHSAARIDFGLAHAIGLAAIALYLVQLTLQIQLAPILLSRGGRAHMWAFLSGLTAGAVAVLVWLAVTRSTLRDRGWYIAAEVVLSLFSGGMAIFSARAANARWWTMALAMACGLAAISAYFVALLRARKRRAWSSATRRRDTSK